MALLQASGVAPQRARGSAGKGLAEHDFFYAGNRRIGNMFIVRNGKVVGPTRPAGKGEIRTQRFCSNGNVALWPISLP